MAMIRLSVGNYICTYEGIIEIRADRLEDAVEKAVIYHKDKYHRSIEGIDTDAGGNCGKRKEDRYACAKICLPDSWHHRCAVLTIYKGG